MAWATFWATFEGHWAIFSQKHLVTQNETKRKVLFTSPAEKDS
jgi:hypothetical protein